MEIHRLDILDNKEKGKKNLSLQMIKAKTVNNSKKNEKLQGKVTVKVSTKMRDY